MSWPPKVKVLEPATLQMNNVFVRKIAKQLPRDLPLEPYTTG